MLNFRIVHSCANFLGLCTAVLIFGQNYEVTLFCREFQYWRIYAFSVLILGVKKWACAIFYTFCMSVSERKKVMVAFMKPVGADGERHEPS